MAVYLVGFIVAGFIAPDVQLFANLLIEALVIATYSIICLHIGGIAYRKGEPLGPVVSKPPIAKMFRIAPIVMYAGLAISLVIAIGLTLLDRTFPMNSIDPKVSIYGFIYREAYLTPNLIVTACIFGAYFFAWFEQLRKGGRYQYPNYVGKLTWLVVGSFAGMSVCAIHWLVSYLQTFNVELIHARGSAFWTIIMLDNVMLVLMGLGWVKGITSSNYESAISKEMEQKETYRFVRLHLSECWQELEEHNPQVHEYLALSENMSSTLQLQYPQQQLARDTLQVLLLANGLGQIDPRITRQKLRTLYEVRDSLLHSDHSAEDGRGRNSLREDCFAEGVPTMTLLYERQTPPDLRQEEEGIQVAAAVAAHAGLLDAATTDALFHRGAVATSVLNGYTLHSNDRY